MRKRYAIGLLAAAILVGLAVAGRREVLPFAIVQAARVAGYTVRIADMRVGSDGAALSGVRVERAGEPLLESSRITLRYSLRDLLPGSRHRFGLLAIEVSGARVTLTRFADGSFNVPLPRPAPAAPVAHVNSVPLAFRLLVRNASIELREPSAYDPSARDFRIEDINVDGSIDTATVTRYRVAGAFEGRRTEPFTIAGRVDAVRGYAMHRARAPYFPLRAFANYFADTPAVRILHGAARDFDAALYALDVAPNVAPRYHVSLRLDVDGGRLALQSLAVPVDGVRAHLEVVDDAVVVRGAHATLAGIPLNIEGGVYDLTRMLTGRTQLRLGVSGTGDLSTLRQAFTFTRGQPISGATRLGVLVAGPIDDPIIVARADAPHARYRTLAFEALAARIVYHTGIVALAPLRASYAGVQLGIRGSLQTGAHLQSRLALHIRGPANRLPYLDEMLGSEPIVIDAAATGRDLLFSVAGSAASVRGVARLAALVGMTPNGTARVEPFWFHTERGDLDGAYILDRPRNTSAFWLLSTNLAMRRPRFNAFPGVALPQMPPIDSRAVGIAVAGGGAGAKVVLAGVVTGGDASIAGVKFDRVEAAFGGTLAHAAVNLLRASGPWGTFAGRGTFSTQQFVALGKYSGTFEGLQPFLGTAINGQGPIAGSVAIALQPQRIVVQGSNLMMRGARLRGVPIDHASLTLAVEGDRLRIYSSHARAAGGDVVAAGTLALVPPSHGHVAPNALALLANRLDAAQLRGIGLPLDAGTLSASGALAAGAPLPAFNGGVVVHAGRVAHLRMAGGGDVRLSGDAVALRRVVGALGGTYARIDGTIGSLASGSPAYALRADVPAAPVSRALRSFGLPNYMTDGSFNARFLIGGRSLSPTIAGEVGVPAGDVNGLPFIDANALIAADLHGVSIRNGTVLVGTTSTHFTAIARPGEDAIDVSAPRADLSDFNNFFDTGDTLDGNGSVKFSAASSGGRVTSSGSVGVRGFRYRNLPIGDTKAVWSSARNAIDGALEVGGSEGTLRARGSIAVTPGRSWQSTLTNSRFNIRAGVDDLDLSLWMPALGMQSIPVTGRVWGQATVRGRYPGIDLRANARVTGGTLGPLTLDTATLLLHTVGERIAIDSAALRTPELSASAGGSFGLAKNALLDLRVYAASDRLAQLVYDVARIKVPVSGSFESTLQIGGTLASPSFLAGFDATGVRAYGIPIVSLFGEVRLQRGALVISNAGATFSHGEATLAGSLPLALAPLRFADLDSPVNFDLDVVGLDPSIFNATLGDNTKLGGLIDGHVGLSGTLRQPAIVGRVAMASGSYVSDLESAPITQIAAALAFNHSSATIERLSARVGNGSAQASGRLDFPNGFTASGASLSVRGSARGANIDLPAYGNGTLDARIALAKKPASKAFLSGDATLTNATLSFGSFVKVAQQTGGVAIPKLPLAFDLRATAGKNVRVRGSGYGAGLDIGTTGSVTLGGTLAAPTLAGAFESTGGTLTYFDRAFRVTQGSIRFNPADGVLPTLRAVATTNVVNPDPDRARNLYGSADITITVEGPIQGLKIGLSSNPPGYTQDQLLALIAPFGGFVGGVGFSRQSMLASQLPSGITPLGTLSPIPNVGLAQNSTITVGQEAFNILNAQFTAGLLAPVESTLGQGLGLSSVNLTLGYYGNVGVTATRLLGKAVSAVYAVTFGLPQIQSFGVVVQPNPATSATLNFFYLSGPTKLLQVPTTPVGYNAGYLIGQPLIGNSGFSLTVQHYFW